MYHRNYTFHLQTAEIDYFYKPKNNCHNFYDFMQKRRKSKGQKGIWLVKVKSPVRSKNVTLRKRLLNTLLKVVAKQILNCSIKAIPSLYIYTKKFPYKRHTITFSSGKG